MRYVHAALVGIVLAAGSLFGQTAEVVPGDNLVVEGIPKIPAALADDAGRYAEFRVAAFMSWHPSRREMLVITRFADTYQVHRVRSPGAARTQLTFFKDNVYTGIAYDPRGGEAFVFSRDQGGDELFQIYRYDFADGRVTLVTDGKSRNTGPLWSNSGDRLVYGSTRRNGKNVDLYVVDPRDPKSDRLLASLSGGGWSAADWSPDGRKILIIEGISANETYVWIFDASTGEKTLLTPKGGKEKIAYGGGKFSNDGKGIYLTADRDSEFQRLLYLDLESRRQTYLTPDTADVDEFDLSPDGKTIAFVRNEKGMSSASP